MMFEGLMSRCTIPDAWAAASASATSAAMRRSSSSCRGTVPSVRSVRPCSPHRPRLAQLCQPKVEQLDAVDSKVYSKPLCSLSESSEASARLEDHQNRY